MFLDLGLTPQEMSRTSGISLREIRECLKRIDERDETALGQGQNSRRRGRANPFGTVLLAEKYALIATDLAWELEARGLVLSKIAYSLVGTLKAVEEEGVGFALLNIELQGGLSYPAARRLRARGIPFAFLTSFEDDEIDPKFRNVARLSKPQDPKIIAECVLGFVRILTQMTSSAKDGKATMLNAAKAGAAASAPAQLKNLA